MSNGKNPQPRQYLGVMVSSTFTDLKQHRAALIKAIKSQGMTDVAMENDSAKADKDVIESSLQMVCDSAAYICLISRKYGQVPACPERNSEGLSITELEFNKALALDRPILLFIMGGGHLLTEADTEADPAKKEKLNAFRERAKRMSPESLVHRVYATFESLEEFREKAINAVADLRRLLDAAEVSAVQLSAPAAKSSEADPTAKPPALYAEPPYLGSHDFIGRQAQLDDISEWASPADSHPVLLFDAIGGSGKSILTWEWTNNHATKVRTDWKGRFWYSFYERGAVMADFCRCALAYITGEPHDSFKSMKTPELAGKLLPHLRSGPWLLVLDGIERVLVSYNRIDAAEIPDEAANQPTDEIADRDPCAAIHPEDDELLRSLAAAAPSKILITSRLVPHVLLNAAKQPVPGVLRKPLPGLRAADAEALLRSCGVSGDSAATQNFLKANCDCHPLVTGVVAGLIKNYMPNRGNFDAWVESPDGGGCLNLATLDLIAKRNHILKQAIHDVPESGRLLLATMGLLSEAVDYEILDAINPFLPAKPEEVEAPEDPRHDWDWDDPSEEEKEETLKEFQTATRHYEQALESWRRSEEYRRAPQKLAATIQDLERRGLVQYDHQTRRYDLHPVVRAIAVGELRKEEKEGHGQPVVDYFSAKSHRPYEEAETLADVADGLRVVRVLLGMGRYSAAVDLLRAGLNGALLFNLEAYETVLSLLKPICARGWGVLSDAVDDDDAAWVAVVAGYALSEMGALSQSLATYGAALAKRLQLANWASAAAVLSNVSLNVESLAQKDQCLDLHLRLAAAIGDQEQLFKARLFCLSFNSSIGRYAEAQSLWEALHPMGRNWSRTSYRPGDAELQYAWLLFRQGKLEEAHLGEAGRLIVAGKDRALLRDFYGLRGEWRLEREEWAPAAESFDQAVHMARAIGRHDASAETRLALARFKLGRLQDVDAVVSQLENQNTVSYLDLANLRLAMGDREKAKHHALAAYKQFWADGEPYVDRYYLTRAQALLQKLGAEVPQMPPYDPGKYEKFPHEDDVRVAVEKLEAEKAAKEEKEKAAMNAPKGRKAVRQKK